MKVADIVYSSFFRLYPEVETSSTPPHYINTYQSDNYMLSPSYSRHPLCRERVCIALPQDIQAVNISRKVYHWLGRPTFVKENVGAAAVKT
ncbi:MAG: hypothetical protein K2L45_06415, partial [Muribaculaceae bacterium]|nr:hypothetical protein [Muribaculaceae bacterium]